MTHHRTLLLLTGLTLLAFGVRVLPLDFQSMWRDEIDTLCFALDFWSTLEQAVGQGQEAQAEPSTAAIERLTAWSSSPLNRPRCQPTPGLSRVTTARGLGPTIRALLTLPGWNGPLYTIAMRPWIGVTGSTPFALRFSSLFFALLAVPLTYALGTRLLGKAIGLVGATLVALSPHLVWYSQEAKMYGAILTLALLAIYGLRRAIDGQGRSARWWGVVIGATTLALYTHILTALLIPLMVVLGRIWWPRTRRHWRGALVALAFLTLPYLPLLTWQARNWLLPAGRATLFTINRLDVIVEATLEGWAGSFVQKPWAIVILVALLLLAAGGLAWRWLMQDAQRWREPLALLVWIALPLGGIWLLSTRQPIFTSRYLIWAAPAFYLLAAAGTVALARQGRGGLWIAGGLLALVLLVDGRALAYQSTQPLKSDFQAAAAHLDQQYQQDDLIIFHLSYMQYNFDYYFTRDYAGWGAPAPAGGMSESDLDFYMQTNTSGYTTIWLVLSEPEMWDPRGLIKAWLDDHTLVPPEANHFAHVSVYRYEMSEK